MIIHYPDWGSHPEAIADYTTTNTSFLRLAKVYKAMGLKNHAFHLSLLQPELKGVDPFSDDLTNEQKTKIVIECKYNVWYYLREVCRVPAVGKPEPSKFLANRANIAMVWCFLNHIDFALIMPRQCGKSVGVDCLNNWLVHIAGTMTNIQLLTKDHQLRKANIARLKAIRDLLPDYLTFVNRTDADNSEELTCNALANRYRTSVSQKSVDVAENIGRGLTAPILQSDEGPYCHNIHISLPVALSGGTAARDIAKQNGSFFGNIFTTTAGKKDSKEGRFFYNLIHDGMYWNERLMDCSDNDAAIAMVKGNSSGDRVIVNGTFSHRQIGKSDEWLKDAIVNSGSGPDMALRDYFNVWTSGSETSPLSNELNDVILRSVRDPSYNQLCHTSYILKWYIPETTIDKRMASGHYIIAIDSSQAVGKDANGMVIVDLKDLSVVATSNICEANLFSYGQWVGDLLIRYPNTTLIIENKSSGQSILDAVSIKLVQAGINPFKRMFNNIIDNPHANRRAYHEVISQGTGLSQSLYMTYKGKFGFITTGRSREFLYGTVLQKAARSSGHMVTDSLLSDQIRALIEKNGRVDHPAGEHDDMVIAWLMAHYFASHATDLGFYGIPAGYTQSMAAADAAILTEEELAKVAQQAKLKLEVEELKNKLDSVQNEIQRYRLQVNIESKLRFVDDEIFQESLNALLEDCKAAKGTGGKQHRNLTKATGHTNLKDMFRMAA